MQCLSRDLKLVTKFSLAMTMKRVWTVMIALVLKKGLNGDAVSSLSLYTLS